MDEVQKKINCVEIVLSSFVDFEDEAQRKEYLRSQFQSNALISIYFSYSINQLKREKEQLLDLQLMTLIVQQRNSSSSSKLRNQYLFCLKSLYFYLLFGWWIDRGQ
jgi:hypothetical protein